ncbi:hypothetical protein INT48_005343 [Thamnidium elegans]|uniref:Uncharacterized protein n=1 Tax=Thamnidium elegans TaxID=101142 RepID=A0A8H7SJD1_9FUNG|nr:hypothetical protein INT48_005343 [Thamnidium elegans]
MNSLEDSPIFDIRSFDDPTQNHEAEQFCTTDSLEASSNYINILLTSYGYPVPLVFNSTQAEDKCKIVNCLYSLLNDRKSDANEKQEFIYTINELKKKQNELENQIVQLKRENHTKDQSNVEIRSKYDANEASFKRHLLQNSRMKEEISKIKNSMQYMKTQYAHETSRHEQELAKTQDRLLKCMNHHYKTRIASLDINTQITAMAPTTADTDEVILIRKKYDDLLLQVSNREREFRLENEDLRICVVNLYTSVRRLLEEQMNQFDNQEKGTKARDIYDETAKFRLPMQCGGKEAIQMVDSLLARLKEEWNKQILEKPEAYTEQDMLEKEETIRALENELDELTHELNDLNQEYQDKLQMYQRFEKGGFFDTLYPNPQSAYISDNEDIVDEDDSYQYQLLKKKVMQDQKRVTRSAIELGQQRAELEAERWAFQEMKREIELQEILKDPPSSTPVRESSSNFDRPERARKRLKSWLGSAPSSN